MEKYRLSTDMKLFCVTAKSFPDCVKEAFDTLEDKLATLEGRVLYGLSYATVQGDIVYKAAIMEVFEGEGERYGFETFVLKKGEYLTITIMDWSEKAQSIPRAFNILLRDPRLDPSYPCVEWYKSEEELMCMVKLL